MLPIKSTTRVALSVPWDLLKQSDVFWEVHQAGMVQILSVLLKQTQMLKTSQLKLFA